VTAALEQPRELGDEAPTADLPLLVEYSARWKQAVNTLQATE
jgi:hypothetical protein